MDSEVARLDKVIANVAEQLGEAWPALEAQLRDNAEALRAAAVAKLAAQAAAPDPDSPDA